MIRFLEITRIFSLPMAAAFATTVAYAQETPPPPAVATTLPIGEWFCNGDEADIYQIHSEKTALHSNDKGTWLATDKLLTVSWENGYRLTIDMPQNGSSIIANSFAPGETQPDKLNFTKLRTTLPDDSRFAKPAMHLPVERNLTDANGRSLQVTITEKTATAIKGKRIADGKDFTLEMAKLSTADQAFVAGLAAAPVTKLRALMIRTSDAETKTALETRGFETVLVNGLLPPPPKGGKHDLSALTAAQIAEFDLLWIVSFSKNPEEIRGILKDYKGVVAYSSSVPGISRSKVLQDEPAERGFVKNAYVKTDGNFVFYCKADSATDGDTRALHPENIEKSADKLVELMRKYHR